MRIETRLHVDEPLAEGMTLGLDHQRAHFLRSVLRLGRGAHVAVFNAEAGEFLAEIEGLGKGWASLSVAERLRAPEAEPDLWLVFAPIKRARLDFMVEKAVELGISALKPVMTQHTAVGRVNVERLAANAREAAEQCERLSVPAVDEPAELMQTISAWPSERRLLLCAEAGEAAPVAEALAEIAAGAGGKPCGPWAVLTGPEGGFHPSELDALRKLPFVTPVSLGPRVLRADTAALAALACWQAWLGDWRRRPPAGG
ncbi:MAG: 16S rRNA (uracil(1498)-N(3))-methyltransferase [Rhodovibrionaceae bacterium]|nr:16S rRNA (uracil(1498)-N(3))-methyltransferase [Rhodovibrionaceae bacterium]